MMITGTEAEKVIQKRKPKKGHGKEDRKFRDENDIPGDLWQREKKVEKKKEKLRKKRKV